MINPKTERARIVRDMLGNTQAQIERLVDTNTVAKIATSIAVEMCRGGLPADADTPEVCAKQACDVADALWTEYEKRGWTFDIPVDIEDGGPVREGSGIGFRYFDGDGDGVVGHRSDHPAGGPDEVPQEGEPVRKGAPIHMVPGDSTSPVLGHKMEGVGAKHEDGDLENANHV